MVFRRHSLRNILRTCLPYYMNNVMPKSVWFSAFNVPGLVMDNIDSSVYLQSARINKVIHAEDVRGRSTNPHDYDQLQ